MNLNCQNILKMTEAQLRYKSDVSLQEATPQELHEALSQAVMMSISENWTKSKRSRIQGRKAHYFSAEYLIGRLVYSNLYNLGILDELKKTFLEVGVDLACMEDIEDAALGNGGLGRLAACFLDSAATCNLPLSGYGLRYRFGLFKQKFDDNGSQKETADDWTKFGDPWSYRRYNHTVKIRFPDHTVLAVPYDVPIIGYETSNIGTLRLWQCEAEEELDFDAFNAQDYQRALDAKNKAEDITRVLYPNDSTWEGKRLRVKQQYVLSSASLQDIIRTYKESHGADLSRLADFTAIQLNDTHPAISIPELIRLLMAEGMNFDQSFAIAQRTFSYTNHTVMGEALEKWNMDLLRTVVPEICDILVRIDNKLKSEHPNLFIIRDNTAHMANLSVYVSSYVNGVAEIHSQILKDSLFRDWYQVYPERFQNKTNGVTPRRWMGLCNPELTQMIKYRVGGDFLTNLDKLENLKPMIDDDMVRQFNQIKHAKKEQLAAVVEKREEVHLNPDFMFDVQVKRAHEYKRQLMNALSVVDIYFRLKDGSLQNFYPTLYLFGAKSAPGYVRAKAVIRYINRISKMINQDPAVRDKLQVLFVQNYGRGQCGDCPESRPGEQLYLRRFCGGAECHPEYLLGPGHLRQQSPPAPGHQYPGRRHRSHRRRAAGAVHRPPGRRFLAPAGPLLHPEGLRLLPGGKAPCQPGLCRPPGLWPQMPHECGLRRQVLLGPDHPPVRLRDLAHHPPAAVTPRLIHTRPAPILRLAGFWRLQGCMTFPSKGVSYSKRGPCSVPVREL